MTKPLWPVWLALTAGACVGDIAGGPGGTPPDDSAPTPGGAPAAAPGEPGAPTPGQPGARPPAAPAPVAGRPPLAAVKTTRFARLGHQQWENTVRDLLRLPAAPGIALRFAPDAVGTFANDGEVLAVSDTLRIDYQTAAEALSLRVARDPAALARLVPANAPADVKGRGAAFIRDFGRRAYRRPLDETEIAAYAALFDQGPALVPGGEPFAAGAQLVMEAMLQSAHFLYRTELQAGPGRTRLGDYEIAAKLSYALASTMPDDALFAAAAASGLRTSDQVTAQAQRLLGKGGEPAASFHDQLFELRGLDLDKDPKLYPEFKPAWQDSIVKESALFLGEIFASDRGLDELLTAPFTFVDATLAPLYGVQAPAAGSGFQRALLDPRQRAGFLTRIAFLARDGLADPEPIRRGAFVNRTLLCIDLSPPPGATDDLPAPPAGARTNRERVDAITSPAVCAACHHRLINPAGFAFEGYDAIGRVRTTDGGVPVNTADTYQFASGPKSFEDAVEWSRLLAESPEAHACYARAWFSYLQGRTAQPEDEPFVTWLAERSRRDRTSLKSLALTVVTDDGFLTRLP
jgi:hypothetical protein